MLLQIHSNFTPKNVCNFCNSALIWDWNIFFLEFYDNFEANKLFYLAFLVSLEVFLKILIVFLAFCRAFYGNFFQFVVWTFFPGIFQLILQMF